MSSIVGMLVRRNLEGPEDSDGLVTRSHARSTDASASSWSYARSGKRVLDISAGLLLLFLFAPAILFLGLLVAMDGGKPFISLRRVGRDGQTIVGPPIGKRAADA